MTDSEADFPTQGSLALATRTQIQGVPHKYLMKYSAALVFLFFFFSPSDIHSMCHALGQGGLGCTFVFREEKEGR